MPRPTYYEILGVAQTAEQEVIDAAYAALKRKYHPGKAPDRAQLERAREVNEAYETLSDRHRREDYNRTIGGSEHRLSREITAREGSNQEPRPNLSAGGRRAQQHKRCIDCAELIQLDARKCRYCGASQESHTKAQSQTTNIHTHVYPMAPEAPAVEPKKYGCGYFAAVLLGLLLILLIFGVGEAVLDSDNAAGTDTNEAATADPLLLDPGVQAGLPREELKVSGGNVTTTAGLSAASGVTVPEAFHGRWAIEPNDCRPGSAKNITSAGVGDRAAGDLTAVKHVSPVSIELQFEMADEGGPFTYSERWTISSNRQQFLLESPEDGSRFTFTRC